MLYQWFTRQARSCSLYDNQQEKERFYTHPGNSFLAEGIGKASPKLGVAVLGCTL